MGQLFLRVIDPITEEIDQYPMYELQSHLHGTWIIPEEIKVDRYLKCRACGHHDWREGISQTHYECDGCSTELRAYFKEQP